MEDFYSWPVQRLEGLVRTLWSNIRSTSSIFLKACSHIGHLSGFRGTQCFDEKGLWYKLWGPVRTGMLMARARPLYAAVLAMPYLG
jgi:hypothetical protein